jgi:hypothetical protein
MKPWFYILNSVPRHVGYSTTPFELPSGPEFAFKQLTNDSINQVSSVRAALINKNLLAGDRNGRQRKDMPVKNFITKYPAVSGLSAEAIPSWNSVVMIDSDDSKGVGCVRVNKFKDFSKARKPPIHHSAFPSSSQRRRTRQ